jgi:hypothetical protein
MDPAVLDSVCKKVYLRFPEVKGARPTVQNYAEGSVLLVFKSKGTTVDGREMKRTIRVVATNDGKISKASASK